MFATKCWPTWTMREQIPKSIGYDTYARLSYGDHPLARPPHGTPQGVAAISIADIRRYRAQVMTRDRLTLSAVGDVDESVAGVLIDRAFAALPAVSQLPPIPAPAATRSQRHDIPMAASEAEVVFGISLGQLSPHQRLVAELLNYTLGGSAFTSRLYRQIRDRHGLAYTIGTSFDAYSVVCEITGAFGAEPDKTELAIGLMREELARLATDGPTDVEVEEAKAALAGQYLRGLIKQVDLANELSLRETQGFQPDYVTTYADRLAEIRPEEIRSFARDVPWLNRLVIITVGALAEPAGAMESAAGRVRSRAGSLPAAGP